MDGNNILDTGAELLTNEWKLTLKRLMDKRDGVAIQPMSQDLHDLLHKSGSAKFVPKRLPGMDSYSFDHLTRTVAPIESDGPEDSEEWNLYDMLTVSDTREEDLKKRHSLSSMLRTWNGAVVSHPAPNADSTGLINL